MGLTTEEKLKDFPFVIYISLNNESHERKIFMENQFKRYGIKHALYLTERLSDMKDVFVHNSNIDNQTATGICVSHLRAMKKWYETFDDEYVIICEDDHSFESIDHWEFTWNGFMDKLPKDWECIQLIRIISPAEDYDKVDVLHKLSLLQGRWWGGASLYKRSYVKKLLDKYVIDDNTFNLFVYDAYLQTILENVLYYGIGKVYNYPILVEDISLYSTFKPENQDDVSYFNDRKHHIVSREKIVELWKKSGKLNI